MQSETLSQEFARLVKEYHEGDDHTKPEAWNLLADYAVDNADAISAALSDKRAGETFTREQMLAEVERRVERALAARSALVDVPVVESDQRLYDGTKPMAAGGDTPMTAAEEVLAWLLVEKVGVPDDAPYSPSQAQEIIVRQLSSPPPTREGEDSAEVKQTVGSHEITDFLYKHGDLTYSAAARAVQLLTGNGYGFTSYSEARKESLLTMRKALNKIADMIDAEDADLDDAISIATTALAATRSGSATGQKGCAE